MRRQPGDGGTWSADPLRVEILTFLGDLRQLQLRVLPNHACQGWEGREGPARESTFQRPLRQIVDWPDIMASSRKGEQNEFQSGQQTVETAAWEQNELGFGPMCAMTAPQSLQACAREVLPVVARNTCERPVRPRTAFRHGMAHRIGTASEITDMQRASHVRTADSMSIQCPS